MFLKIQLHFAEYLMQMDFCTFVFIAKLLKSMVVSINHFIGNHNKVVIYFLYHTNASIDGIVNMLNHENQFFVVNQMIHLGFGQHKSHVSPLRASTIIVACFSW